MSPGNHVSSHNQLFKVKLATMITGTELKGRWADLCTVTQKLSQGTVELHLRAPASPHPALSRPLRAEDADSACHHPEPHNGLTPPRGAATATTHRSPTPPTAPETTPQLPE